MAKLIPLRPPKADFEEHSDVRVYNYPLTAAQVKEAMNEGAVRFGPVSGSP